MIINYFDKYNIDTKNIEEKLNIISKSNTENANYITHMLMNALNYLFSIKDNTYNLYASMPENIESENAIVYFDTITENKKFFLESLKIKKKIIIGNHKTRKIEDNVILINIKELGKIKKELKEFSSVYIGFNIDSIDFSKYYYNRMRSYFLNILNSLNEVKEEVLRENTEEICEKILLEKENFKSYFLVDDKKIEFKEMVKAYYKIIKNIKTNRINGKYMFCNKKEDLTEMEKSMQAELSELLEILNIKDKKEKTSKIYDLTCESMQKEIRALNYCNFIDNKCVTMRYTKGFPNSKENGCCANTYKDKKKNCRYLKDDYSCLICSISCRIFTCTYLQDRGIDHALWQYPIIDCTMGKREKQKIILNFFTPKEKMMKKLK